MDFKLSTQVCTGSAAAILASLHIDRLMLVCDPFFVKNGVAAALSRGKAVEIFDRVTPDPSLTLAAQGTAAVQQFQPQVIAAVGGGSAMDCAKAMAYFSGLAPKLVAIPTTSGSGSEVTDFAILTHDGVKHPLVDEKLRPSLAILDGSLVESLPRGLVAEGGFDLLSHALEAVAATGAGPITDALAEAAFCTAMTWLPGSFAGDKSHRLDIHCAATMAGIAFSQAGLGLCHGLSHALGGEFHVPHGRLNAILLPAVLEVNAPAAAEKYARLARRLGLSGGSDAMAVRALKNALVRLRRNLQLPENLAQAGVSLHGRLKPIVTATLADPCCQTNPVPVTEALVRQVLSHV